MAGCERLVYSANLSTGLFKVRWFLVEGFSHARSVLQGFYFLIASSLYRRQETLFNHSKSIVAISKWQIRIVLESLSRS